MYGQGFENELLDRRTGTCYPFRMKKSILLPAVAAGVLLFIFSVPHFFTPLLIISDPVWRVTVLEGDEGIYPRLRIALLKKGYIPKLVVPESFSQENPSQIIAGELAETAEIRRRGPILLSPGLSYLAEDLTSLVPDRVLIIFAESEAGGSAVRIAADPIDALKEAGAAARSEFPTKESRLLLPVREAKAAAENSHTRAFAEGWGEGEVLRISMGKDSLEEELQKYGAGKSDFAWVSQEEVTGRVLSILAEYGVFSCCFGPYALRAYPQTVVCELRYSWKEAILEALAYAGKAGGEPGFVVGMGTELNFVLFRK